MRARLREVLAQLFAKLKDRALEWAATAIFASTLSAVSVMKDFLVSWPFTGPIVAIMCAVAFFILGRLQAQRAQHAAPAKVAALELLARLRKEGIEIRDAARELYYPGDPNDWSHKVDEWKNDVAEALKLVSGADSEWFSTLDLVPPARVPAPNIRRGRDIHIEFSATFNQHDYRLARLESILEKYGVGV